MHRRKLLQALGLGAVAAPMTIKELIASSPEATEFVNDIDRQLGIKPEPPTIPEIWAKSGLEILEENMTISQMTDKFMASDIIYGLTDYTPCNSGDVSCVNGDQINVTHTHNFGLHPQECQCGGHNQTTKSRVRTWEILVATTFCGVCFEGLVIKTSEGMYRLATKDEVRLVSDTHEGITKEEWVDPHLQIRDLVAEALPEAVKKMQESIDRAILGRVQDYLS